MTAQINITDPVPSDQEKLNKKSFLAAPRALMDKEGFLKMEERITAESLYTAYKCHGRLIFLIVSELESLSLDMIRWLIT
jgi:hypothetical protein